MWVRLLEASSPLIHSLRPLKRDSLRKFPKTLPSANRVSTRFFSTTGISKNETDVSGWDDGELLLKIMFNGTGNNGNFQTRGNPNNRSPVSALLTIQSILHWFWGSSRQLLAWLQFYATSFWVIATRNIPIFIKYQLTHLFMQVYRWAGGFFKLTEYCTIKFMREF